MNNIKQLSRLLLGVNIDHIATIRQARGTSYPNPVDAALQIEKAGADSITLHLREDRRHIQDSDVFTLKKCMKTRMNLEMAVTDEMVAIAEQVKPEDCCLVPEKREELTTEGGLDVISNVDGITKACQRLSDAGVKVSLFIDADMQQIEAAKKTGAPAIELHTGHYADATSSDETNRLLNKMIEAAEFAESLGIQVNAGHGLTQKNIKPVASIPQIKELNIGHAIIADAVFVGLDQTIEDYLRLMEEARIGQ